MNHDSALTRWTISWAAFAIALGLHVVDEAITGFLPFYNSVVGLLRERHPWVPLPTFTFSVWMGGLTVLVVALLALTPLTLRGYKWLRVTSYILGVTMIVNAIGHVTASVWLRDFAPGVYSSPVLLVAATALLITTAQSRDHDVQRGA
jgi:hypothetical protein